MFAKSKGKKPVMQKQIPTVVGLLVLLGSLVSGLVFFGDGTGVFAPRATAEATPKNIALSNLKADSFTVSFYTDKATTGFIKYGEEPSRLSSQASDDRDQLSGSTGEYSLHHITVRGLEPGTDYYYVLGTESKNEFDNEGQPFKISTPPSPSGSMPPAITVYGSISNESGTPAEGSIVYVTSSEMGTLSSLVKGSGSWAVPLSQALTKGGSDYADLTEADLLGLRVVGETPDQIIEYTVTVEEAQPVRELSFGQDYDNLMADEPIQEADEEIPTESVEAGETDEAFDEIVDEATSSADLETEDEEQLADDVSDQMQQMLEEADALPRESTASSELVLRGDSTDEPVYTTSKPTIKGNLEPNIEVKISVHSETQYETTLTTADDGSFELDLEALGLELEPGEHTVTYSYIDPNTGEEVVVTEDFLVEDSEQVMLAQADTSTATNNNSLSDTSATNDSTTTESTGPYGTGSPYPMSLPTPTPIPQDEVATEATTTARQQPVGTDGALVEAGSIGATLLLAISGLFFITIGSWSWWLAAELEVED